MKRMLTLTLLGYLSLCHTGAAQHLPFHPSYCGSAICFAIADYFDGSNRVRPTISTTQNLGSDKSTYHIEYGNVGSIDIAADTHIDCKNLHPSDIKTLVRSGANSARGSLRGKLGNGNCYALDVVYSTNRPDALKDFTDSTIGRMWLYDTRRQQVFPQGPIPITDELIYPTLAH